MRVNTTDRLPPIREERTSRQDGPTDCQQQLSALRTPGTLNRAGNSQGSPSPGGAQTRLPRSRMNLPYSESVLRDGPDFVRDPSQDNPSLDFSTLPGALLSGIETDQPESRMNRPYKESALLADARFAPLDETVNRNVQEKAGASSPAIPSEPYSKHHWRNI